MAKATGIIFFLLLSTWNTVSCAGVERPAVWAGKFYPEDPVALRKTISGLIEKAGGTSVRQRPEGRLRALILPHAGYIYSGLTAAHAHGVLAGNQFEKVLLMGPDHRVGFAGAAVSAVGAYRTPLGMVAVHADAARLAAADKRFRAIAESDRSEHCIEVVLPFLQYDLPSFELLPVVMGRCDPRQTAVALAPYVDGQTLVVVSADLSHYLPYDRARAIDRQTIQAILDLDADPIVNEENRTCGRNPVAVLIHLAGRFGWHPHLLHYSNSGDTAGERSAVVGYAAIAFYGEKIMSSTPSPLSDDQGKILLALARQTLNKKFGHPPSDEQAKRLEAQLDDPDLKRACGTFVTLKIDNNLRGCIGSLVGHEPLVEGVCTNALHAAFDDPRFKPLTEKELAKVAIEVSVLSEPQPLSYSDGEDLVAKLKPGRDGVILRKGGASATFLPQVWEQLPRAEAFLSHLCMKAGLPADAWRSENLVVETYQVQYFEESH